MFNSFLFINTVFSVAAISSQTLSLVKFTTFNCLYLFLVKHNITRSLRVTEQFNHKIKWIWYIVLLVTIVCLIASLLTNLSARLMLGRKEVPIFLAWNKKSKALITATYNWNKAGPIVSSAWFSKCSLLLSIIGYFKSILMTIWKCVMLEIEDDNFRQNLWHMIYKDCNKQFVMFMGSDTVEWMSEHTVLLILLVPLFLLPIMHPANKKTKHMFNNDTDKPISESISEDFVSVF